MIPSGSLLNMQRRSLPISIAIIAPACLIGKQSQLHTAKNGHYSSAIAHMGTHVLTLGKSSSQQKVKGALHTNSDVKDAIERMSEQPRRHRPQRRHAQARRLTDQRWQKVTGEFSGAANKLDRDHYRKGFNLPNA